ncbi:MAG: hypothetical protein WC473_03395 [Patescibacteria group bacterium]
MSNEDAAPKAIEIDRAAEKLEDLVFSAEIEDTRMVPVTKALAKGMFSLVFNFKEGFDLIKEEDIIGSVSKSGVAISISFINRTVLVVILSDIESTGRVEVGVFDSVSKQWTPSDYSPGQPLPIYVNATLTEAIFVDEYFFVFTNETIRQTALEILQTMQALPTKEKIPQVEIPAKAENPAE